MKPTRGIEKLSALEFSRMMLKRLEENDAEARGMANEAYKRGDQETVWVAKAILAENERSRLKLPKQSEK